MTSGTVSMVIERTAALEEAFGHLRNLVPTRDAVSAAPTGHLTALLYTYGWSRAVLGEAKALDAIHAAGLGAEAAPIRQLLIGHAAKAEWLIKDPDTAVDVLDDASVYDLKKLRTAAVAAQMVAPGGGSHLDEHPPSGSSQMTMAHAGSLMTKLGLKASRATWLIETPLTHAGTATAERFVDADGDEAVLLDGVPDDMDDELYRSALSKVLALDAILRAFDAVAPSLALESSRRAVEDDIARVFAATEVTT